MNILIVGSGAREHAIAAALHRSPQKPHLFCCATSENPGIKQMTMDYWIGDINNIFAISALAKKWGISLAIIGPEAPLEKGLADELWQFSIPTIGPKQNLAQIETSKSFARDLMQKYNIPVRQFIKRLTILLKSAISSPLFQKMVMSLKQTV